MDGNERLPCQNCSVLLKLEIIHIVKFGSLITEMNVCRVKTAAFGFQEPSKGARSYNFWLQMKKAGNHTYCKVWVTDNGNERLPCQNCCVWLASAIKGGAHLQMVAGNEKG